nr:MAG TPA: hypothetical protein [Caudoviricetes sp.]
MILLDCESRKELDNIQHPAAFVLPGCDRGTHLPTNSLNVPAGHFALLSSGTVRACTRRGL